MVEIRFYLLRVLIDCLCAALIFFGILCGIHYGTIVTGLYFGFMKFLFGFVGAGLAIYAYRWLRYSVLFMIKCGSIYAIAHPECTSIIASFKGAFSHFNSTVAVSIFNKLIRESSGYVRERILDESDNTFLESLRELLNTRLAKISKKIIIKLFDYVDECILGYCYKNVSDEKSIYVCALEAFTIFCTNPVKLVSKLITTVSLQIIFKCFFWIIFIMVSVKYFPISGMNIIMCYCIGKALSFILDDSILEPALMHGIIKSFQKTVLKKNEGNVGDIVTSIPPLTKIAKLAGIEVPNDVDENTDEGTDESEDTSVDKEAGKDT